MLTELVKVDDILRTGLPETENTLCFKKYHPFYFYDNYVRCRRIFIILSLADSLVNL